MTKRATDNQTDARVAAGLAALRLFEALTKLDPSIWDTTSVTTLSPLIEPWPTSLVDRVHARVCMEGSRPFPMSKLFAMAAELASPRPDVEQVYAELMHKARAGVYQRPHPDRPGIRLAGAPELSCEFVRLVLARLRPWDDICAGDAGYDAGLYKQVADAYAHVAAAWNRGVIDMLCRRPEQREGSVYFAPYRPWQPAVQEYAVPGARKAQLRMVSADKLVPMPEELRLSRQKLIEGAKDE